ncbi:MAG: CopG family transcriptional regulator [Caldimonas sp.]
MTTIRFEDDLKARVAAAAEREGRTTHVFILDAIAHAVEQAELDEELQRVAEVRWTKVLATGKTVPWEDAKDYLKAQPVEGRSRKPAARKLRPRSAEHGTNRARAEGPERLR